MSIPAIDITIRVMVSESAADDLNLLDKMASEIESQLERMDEIMSMKFGSDYSHFNIELD